MLPHPIILAGGLGERCKPITNFRPKCLIPVNGKPIIQHQIEQLIGLGFKKVTILLGKFDNFVNEYIAFKNFKIEIETVSTPIDFSSSQRLTNYLYRSSVSMNNFDDLLIIYCDNLLSNIYIENVLSNSNNIFFLQKRTVGNIVINGNQAIYRSKTRSEKLPYVELGYIKIKKHLLFENLEKFEDLPDFLIYVSSKTQFNWVEVNSYISLTSFDKTLDMCRDSRLLILDRDGVITVKPQHRTYLLDLKKIEYIENNIEGLQNLSKRDYLFVVCTNQPAVGLNLISSEDLQQIHQKICLDLIKRDVHILDFITCEHTWDDNCNCRKPKPGLLNLAKNRYSNFSNKGKYIYVGDQSTDREAALAAEIRSVNVGSELVENTFTDIKSAAGFILK